MPDFAPDQNAAPSATPTAPSTPVTPAPATQEPAGPTQPAPTPAGATPPQTPDPGQAPGDGWVPSYRLRETREAAAREAQAQFEAVLAQERAAAQTQLAAVQRQLHALVGVTPREQTEADTIRQQFQQLFPKLATLEEQADAVQQLLERSEQIQDVSRHHWRSYAKSAVDRLVDLASKDLGPLNEDARRLVHANFVGYLQSDPELVARYENDPSIVEDFWSQFRTMFIDPARRTSTASAVQRATTPTPQNAPSGPPAPSATPAPQSMEERLKLGWQHYNASVASKQP